jgi:hypothetical protein
VSLRPGYVDAHVNLGAVYEDAGQLRDAVRAYERAIAIDGQSAAAHFNRSLAWLRSGELARGWQEYEWRWKHNGRPRCFVQPEWSGAATSDAVLVYSEQGIGDEILFASCLPDVIERVGMCVLECDARLMRLFTRSFPSARVVARSGAGAAAPIPTSVQFDAQIAIGSLPKLLRQTPAEFPQQAYLQPDAQKVAEWKSRYAALGGKLTIGISWRGGKDPSARRARSTSLSDWRPIFEIPGVMFVNLQYGDCRNDLEELRNSGITLHDWNFANPLGDLDEFAARVAALDLVISVDNSTVHLAGAMGVPVRALLPFAADWRWMLEPETTCWYPSVRLYRRGRDENWKHVFSRVVA